MERYEIRLDPAAAAFYNKVSELSGRPTEQVLADALYKLAGELSIEAILKSSHAPG
ncbi:MAG: hypothetical protein Q3977_02335 [Oscillospiraceae bacterium]|nr:hypothetical protein [Oscillospiraceae bacterium]